jgi:hypothetical protein
VFFYRAAFVEETPCGCQRVHSRRSCRSQRTRL